jgi:hypothetical protein
VSDPNRLQRDLSESALDLTRCAAIGRQLAAERLRRLLTIEEAAQHLLFSKRQLKALEQPEPRVFHAPAYFLRALRKYCLYLGLSPDLVDSVTAAPPDEHETHARQSPGRRSTITALILALLVSLAVGAWFLLNARSPLQNRAEPLPLPPRAVSVPVPEMAAPPAPALEAASQPDGVGDVPPERVLHVAEPMIPPAPWTGGPGPGQGGVAVARETWVFVRYPDNSTVERRMAAGERVAFEALPVYVAVGMAAGVELTLGERPVDVSPFVSNGQVRITREDILALTGRR